MSNPSSNPGNGEEDWIHIGWEPHGSVDKTRVKVNIGI